MKALIFEYSNDIKALGAEIFERHIGLPADNITLNKYSSTQSRLING